MPIILYNKIADDLERKIREGVFGDKLPGVRTLAAEYCVSLQTMSNALHFLRDKGLLVPSSRGTRILRNGRSPDGLNLVSVFACAPEPLDLNRHELLKYLREEAEADGVGLVLMWISDSRLFMRKNFWESPVTDGYIFVYSSFYPVLKKQLQESEIPFVVANWMPEECKVHWIDWDNRKIYFDVVQQLFLHGVRRIGYMPHLRFLKGVGYHLDVWNDVCNYYGIENYSDTEEYYSAHPLKNAKLWLERGKADFPEVILSFNSDIVPLLAFLDRHQLDCRVLCGELPREVEHPRILRFSKHNYRILAHQIWEVFRKVYFKEAGAPRAHLVKDTLTIEGWDKQQFPA